MAKLGRQIEAMAELFRVLGEKNRLRILFELEEGELNVSELCKRLKVPQPTVSHHLGILRVSGLLTNRRSGKEVFYALNREYKERGGKALAAWLGDAACLKIGPFVLGRENT